MQKHAVQCAVDENKNPYKIICKNITWDQSCRCGVPWKLSTYNNIFPYKLIMERNELNFDKRVSLIIVSKSFK